MINLKKKLSEQEIELQMERALKKIPFEVKKIKFVLEIVKRVKRLKKIFKI